MKSLVNFIVFPFLVLCCSITSFSQVYNFKTFTEDDGLPQSYIYSISQDEKGFLYLSTGNGFAAYGGTKFKSFTKEDGLSENFASVHFADSRGIIWIGHYQNGISYLRNNKFSIVEGSEKFGSRITSFAEDKNKNIWFVVQGKGIYFVDSTFVLRTPIFQEPVIANCIDIDSAGLLLIGSDNGIQLYNVAKASNPQLLANLNELQNKNVKFIIKDSQGTNLFWVGVPGEAVYALKSNIGFYKISATINEGLNSSSKNILCLYSDAASNLWVSLAEEGLKKIIFPDHQNQGIYTVQTINKKNGLPNLFIQSIFEDYEGNMWFGTIGGGLIQLPIQSFNFYKPAPNNNITSLVIDHLGSFWMGTPIGLLNYTITNEQETKLFNSKNGFVDDQVNAVFIDKTGLLWIGTEHNGIYTFDILSGKFKSFSKEKKLTSLTINCITESNNGQLLIGTIDGVYFYNPKTDQVVELTTLEGLLHNNVNHLFCDSKNRIWISSHGAPPYYMLHDEFTVLKDIPGLKNYNINSISESPNGLIWITSEGDGMFSYDGTNVRNFRVEDGLMSNFCYSVECTSTNEVWVGHKNGLSCLSNGGKTISKFNKSTGLLFNEFNANASFEGVGDNLWFGSVDGIVRYSLREKKSIGVETRSSILLLTLNDKSFDVADMTVVPYNKYNVRIDFVGVSLSDPSKVNFKYRLLGLDTAWRFTKERFVEFPKLADGNYTFQLVAGTSTDGWNTSVREVSFEIGLPFWKKIWFWFLVSIFVVSLIYLFIQYRTKALRKTQANLEGKVKEKTFQLEKEKLELERITEILEEKDKDITDSINYAKKIQEALLPSKENLLQLFPKTFIYYKPRDIVSGDFYWFSETEDGYIIAVVDCTGHGIPGAFMSLIGSTLISEIIFNKNITDPAKLLYELDKDIIHSLGQSSGLNSSRDGMDVAICRINKSKTQMTFSSAARPMYYFRNGELLEINLKAHSVGGTYDGLTKKYSNVVIDLLPNDIFYLFSDGYADQFNFENDKKFSSKKLKNLLVKIASMSPEEQYREIDNAHLDWKGDQKQIDDITIIGFKIG